MTSINAILDRDFMKSHLHWQIVQALMLFPDNEAKQLEFCDNFPNSISPNSKDRGADDFTFPETQRVYVAIAGICELLSELKEQKRQSMISEAMSPVLLTTKGKNSLPCGGIVAGATLLFPLLITRTQKRFAKECQKIGRGSAYDGISKEFGNQISKRSLQYNWRKYERVAHLWAAHNVVGELPNAGNFPKYYGVACALREEAASHIPFRESEALLPYAHSIDLKAIFSFCGFEVEQVDWFESFLSGHPLTRALKSALVQG